MHMDQPPLDYVKVREGACTPTRDTADSVGYDLKSPSNYLIQAGTSAVIPTGLAIKIPKGYSGRLATKSVQAWKYSLIALEELLIQVIQRKFMLYYMCWEVKTMR